MDIPSKLQRDLFKPYEEQSDAFKKFLAGIEIFTPAFRLDSQDRYSAFYYRGRPVVYIEPQRSSIVFGFFRNDIREYYELHRDEFCHFPDWNTARGGLVGYDLGGFDDRLRLRLATISLLVVMSYHKRIRWPTNTCTLS
jgi:hypothetical protein